MLGNSAYQFLRYFTFTGSTSRSKIHVPKAKQNIFEGRLLVRCGILTIKNGKSFIYDNIEC